MVESHHKEDKNLETKKNYRLNNYEGFENSRFYHLDMIHERIL
jgi:hypothetical protein